MDIQSAKVLVTGGGSGMGRSFVLSLARLGAHVAFCDLSQEAVDATVAEATGLPGKVVGFIADVSSEDDVVRLVKDSAAALGGLNGLINNAGIFRDGLLIKPDKATGTVKRMRITQPSKPGSWQTPSCGPRSWRATASGWARSRRASSTPRSCRA